MLRTSQISFVPEVGITKLKKWKNKLQRLNVGKVECDR
jgi:hypothetical protein